MATTDTARRWTGDINYIGLREALDFFDVKLPVKIRRANGRTRWGSHRFRDNGHFITISTYLTVEQANQTLLHELCHASQLERCLTDDPRRAAINFSTLYRIENAHRGYRENRFEVEAREASTLSDDLRVVR